MKTLVSIPEDIAEKMEEYRLKNYPDLTIPKMLVRIAWDRIVRVEVK